jgi:hypothetical protein
LKDTTKIGGKFDVGLAASFDEQSLIKLPPPRSKTQTPKGREDLMINYT